ncbi:MAG: hypothetical protein IKT75_07010 [Alistipes sp.]|nr:hypothetical protein [Alistipes sp.]
MKLFSKLWASIAMLSMLSLATSCENSEEPITPAEPEYVTVSLGLNVNLDYEYEPLTRAEENNDLYGIQVYSTPVPATENAEWTKYAYGLFDNTDNLTIKLVRGYEYKFETIMVKDGKDKVDYNAYYDTYTYGGPFNHETSPGSYISCNTPLSTSFIYSTLGMREWSYYGLWNYLNVELYYGELEGYTPGDNDSKATIELKRTSFGAKFIAKGDYAENGVLEVIMGNSSQPHLTLNLAEGNEVSEIFSFKNVRAAWLDENYTETISVILRIAYSDGTSAPLGTHDITFKRNTTTVVNVDLTVSGDSGVGFVITDDGEMPEGDEITIKDGEIVDTEIETN